MENNNPIRSLRVKIFDNDHNCRDFFYVKGSLVTIGRDENQQPIKKTIANIEFDEGCFKIYVQADSEIQFWKSEPKNQFSTEEYEVD